MSVTAAFTVLTMDSLPWQHLARGYSSVQHGVTLSLATSVVQHDLQVNVAPSQHFASNGGSSQMSASAPEGPRPDRKSTAKSIGIKRLFQTLNCPKKNG
jgi:hypothetical protein